VNDYVMNGYYDLDEKYLAGALHHVNMAGPQYQELFPWSTSIFMKKEHYEDFNIKRKHF
jgi:hypothetical protein